MEAWSARITPQTPSVVQTVKGEAPSRKLAALSTCHQACGSSSRWSQALWNQADPELLWLLLWFLLTDAYVHKRLGLNGTPWSSNYETQKVPAPG